MSIKIIQDRLDQYQCQSLQEEDLALGEITQELVLNSLYNAGFFKVAAFQGGTCLRILYGLNRFSEDLDFALLEPDADFELKKFLSSITEELRAFGYNIKVEPRPARRAMQNAFLKDDSLGRILAIQHRRADGPARALKIKLEVDTNPPDGAVSELKLHDFPIYFSVTTHDLPSLFAGKSHALLCRPYVKGRDWFDFLFYIARKAAINFDFLSSALDQAGPWKGRGVTVDRKWYQTQMSQRIKEIDWSKAKADVQRFLKPGDVRTLELWGSAFFLANLERL